MRMAADYPDEICACVVEDMDARPRGSAMSAAFHYPSLRAFDPVGTSPADVAARLRAAAPDVFDAERVAGYLARGRILEAPGGSAVSLVQPLGFALAYDRQGGGRLYVRAMYCSSLLFHFECTFTVLLRCSPVHCRGLFVSLKGGSSSASFNPT